TAAHDVRSEGLPTPESRLLVGDDRPGFCPGDWLPPIRSLLTTFYCRMLGGSKPSPSGEGFSVLGHSPGRKRGSSAVRPRSVFHTVKPRAASAGCLVEP